MQVELAEELETSLSLPQASLVSSPALRPWMDACMSEALVEVEFFYLLYTFFPLQI